PFPGYGGAGWVRVVGRVLIVPPQRRKANGEFAGIRGWRSFVGIPVGFSNVEITIGDRTQIVAADRGGVVDTVIQADLEPGWQRITMSVEGQPPVEGTVFIVDESVDFGVICDVD